MKIIIRILFLFSGFVCTSTTAQIGSADNCGTVKYNSLLMQRNKEFAEKHKSFESYIQKQPNSIQTTGSDSVWTIPVVVHVVYSKNSENIADQQIDSQIEVLNEDYSGTNLDQILIPNGFKNVKAGDIGLRFCLATLDPDNQPTNGITRTLTSVAEFGFSDDVKFTDQGGEDAWPADKYLNIWVCNLGGGLLGYAQYPGGPDSTDGVVILYKAFGKNGTAVKPYNKGRTVTHEVGHWFNLFHIWGDDGSDCSGTDYVNDTPNQAGSNTGCPTYPAISCNNGPNGDMFMNYLDYSNDSCMYMFTKGQKNRMLNALDNLRPSIKISSQTDCTPLYPEPDYSTSILPNPNNGSFILRFKKNIPDSCSLNLYDILGQVVFSYQVTGIESRSLPIEINSVADGIYFLQTEVADKTFVNKIVILN